MTLRDELRALPTFPDDLPELDPGELPGSGLDVVVAWLREAIATGER